MDAALEIATHLLSGIIGALVFAFRAGRKSGKLDTDMEAQKNNHNSLAEKMDAEFANLRSEMGNMRNDQHKVELAVTRVSAKLDMLLDFQASPKTTPRSRKSSQ